MRTYRRARAAGAPLVGIWFAPLLLLGVATAAQGQASIEAGVQVLTRGPVHEAFAETSMTWATAGVVIDKSPYDTITEMPPDQRPEGANVAWIPGYWSWDDDRSDFIWVSGVWRYVPPGRQWVPGYWAPVQGGSQWISGFWGDVAQTEVTYLPPPPKPLEVGPSSPAPAPGHLWTSGCWVWQQTRYDWQPGYWVVQQPDWVWSPAHYTWTPRGYVYVPGYWDHDIVHRGVMFAPVYYEQPVYRRPSYSYSPSIMIDLGAIVACLFVRPTSHQYYFGDYYDHRYEERGFRPWYSKHATPYDHDPIYVHYRSQQLRQDPDWDVHIDEQYRHRRDHVDARPPQTLALQVNIINNRKAGVPEGLIIGRSLTEAAQGNTQPVRFTSVSMDERKQIQTRGREVNRLQSERARIEKPPKADGKSHGARETAQPVRMQLPPSPVAARPTHDMKDAKSPPPTPVTPKPQAAEGRGRQDTPHRVEVKAESDHVPRDAGQGEAQRGRSSPRYGGTASPTRENPKRTAPETTRSESTPHRTAPSSEVRPHEAKPEAKPHRTEPQKQEGHRDQAPNAEGQKNRKHEKR